MKLTKQHIESLATDRGGYTKATLSALNVPWDSVHHSGLKGWKRKLIGQEVTDEQYQQALNNKTVFGKW